MRCVWPYTALWRMACKSPKMKLICFHKIIWSASIILCLWFFSSKPFPFAWCFPPPERRVVGWEILKNMLCSSYHPSLFQGIIYYFFLLFIFKIFIFQSQFIFCMILYCFQLSFKIIVAWNSQNIEMAVCLIIWKSLEVTDVKDSLPSYKG